SRWYPGGGIYRNVWLIKTAPVHVVHWGTYITTPQVSKESATIDIKATVQNDSKSGAAVKVKTAIYTADDAGKRSGRAVASIEASSLLIGGGKSVTNHSTVVIPGPRLWSTTHPSLYVAVTSIE